MPQTVVNLGLDSTRFIVRLQDTDIKHGPEYQTYIAVHQFIQGCTGDFVKGAANWEHKDYPIFKASMPLPGGSTLVTSLSWSTKAKRHIASFKFNPSKLTADAAVQLLGTFATLFDDGYAEFTERAICNAIEIPLDVVGAW